MEAFTRIDKVGNVLVKRDDLYDIFGSIGGKARSCLALVKEAVEKGHKGVVTAGSRESPQILLVSNIAKSMGMKSAAHTPTGTLDGTPVGMARDIIGCDIVQHKAGYNNVIKRRAKDYATEHGFFYIPFGMACGTAITETAAQVEGILPYLGDIKRIVVPVGSGMSLAGIVTGLVQRGINIPVLGVVVGAQPHRRMDAYAPFLWRSIVTLVDAGVPYSTHVEFGFGDIILDQVYEAKAGKFLRDGDLFWIVGTRDMPSITGGSMKYNK